MEMKAVEDIEIGQDLSPPLFPLAFSLYDSSLLSRCSACFSLLPSSPSDPHNSLSSLLFCSPECSASIHPRISAAERHLLRSHLSDGDTSDLRAAVRLIFHFENSGDISESRHFPARIRGLLSNREKLLMSGENDDDVVLRIRDGAKAIAVARRMRDGLDLDLDFSGDCLVEEAVLCAVLTNAVEVQVKGGGNVGIAVYDTDFSWINHSCSPNACYRFLPPEFSGCESRLWIAPATTAVGGGIKLVDNPDCNKFESTNEHKGNGPRVVVRSIKAINKGDEVSIAYTDLLQPKALRQSELWLKYQFVCCCRRCNAFSPSYADRALQEVSVINLDSTNPRFDQNFYREKEIQNLADYIESTISDYLSLGNAESCCENLEKALTQKIKLHPLHHLSLNTYTTLASAYKVCGIHLLDHNPNPNYTRAFNMRRIGCAYSFLLAASTHNLFLSEFSLIASAANYWTYAGESLLSLSRSTLWDSVLNRSDFAPFRNPKICDCALVMNSEPDFAEFEDISQEFLHCITNITPNAWTFLVSGNFYLRTIDISWLGMKLYDNVFKEGFGEAERMNVFRLGIHCLVYGGFLSRICWGDDSYLTRPVRSILNGECT